MDLSARRRSWILSAFALAALASAPRAAAADLGKARRTSSEVADLGGDIARPDDFKRFVEGSREKRGDADAPDVLAQAAERGPRAPVRLSRPESGPRPDGTAVPPTAAPAAGPGAAPARFVWTPDLKTRKIAAVLGLGLMLIAGSWLETPMESEAEPRAGGEPAPALPSRRRGPEPFRAPEPALEPTRLANALADPTFIDTRMPAPTWRAISWREQRLIDGWTASREKSLGLASLGEWLDAQGFAEGVDVPLLKAKLFRDA